MLLTLMKAPEVDQGMNINIKKNYGQSIKGGGGLLSLLSVHLVGFWKVPMPSLWVDAEGEHPNLAQPSKHILLCD